MGGDTSAILPSDLLPEDQKAKRVVCDREWEISYSE